MRKRLLVLIGLVLVVVVIAIVGLAGSGSKVSVCNQLALSLQKGDTEKSFALLTPDAQKTFTGNAWQKEVKNLQAAYGTQGKVTLQTDPNKTSLHATTSETVEEYKIKNHDSTYLLTCYLTKTQDTYLINGFTSRPTIK